MSAGSRASAHSQGQVGWTVSIRGQDVSRAADPRFESGVLMVDAAALGPTLPLIIRAAGREARVRDAVGLDWQGAAGDSLLSSPGRSLLLERPIRIDGPSVFLPAKAVAELAGVRLDIDPDSRTAAFAGNEGSTAAAPAGWQGLLLPRPVQPSNGAPLPGRNQDILLPPDHDTLRVGLTLGAVTGADGEGELTGAGSVRGIDTALSLLGSSGSRGYELQNSHLALADSGRGLGFEAGDLFSAIWGLAQGARFRWRRGEGDGSSWSALSIYRGDPGGGNPKTVASYSDEIILGRWGSAGGEVASDGSWLASGRFRQQRLSLFGYLRNASGTFGAGRGSGLSGSLDLPWNLQLQGSLSRGGAGDQRFDDRTLSLRVPLRLGSDVTLATDQFAIGRTRGSIDSVAIATIFGRLRLQARGQLRETQFPGFQSTPAQSTAERDLITSGSWLLGTRLRIEAQLVERWPGSSQRTEWRQLSTALALSQRTSLQFIGASSSSGSGSAFRVRLDQEIRPGFSFFVEAGDVVTFQPVTGPGEADKKRLRIMVHRSLDLATPAAGSGVEGFVGSSGSISTAGLPVELGPYRTVTNRDGGYSFPNVPPGEYDLRLREQGLPADATAGPPARVRVKRGESQRANLSVVPLGEARGWVYVDRNGNHRRDPGEEIANVVVILDDRVTATALDGSFGFFNLLPGAHRLQIKSDQLPQGLVALIPNRMELGLPAGSSVAGLEFRLQEKHKPVVFQETRK